MKSWCIKNNKLEAVVISTQEYERLKELEELMNNIEHKEIYEIIQSRIKTQNLIIYQLKIWLKSLI